jgi:hypothetical protein
MVKPEMVTTANRGMVSASVAPAPDLEGEVRAPLAVPLRSREPVRSASLIVQTGWGSGVYLSASNRGFSVTPTSVLWCNDNHRDYLSIHSLGKAKVSLTEGGGCIEEDSRCSVVSLFADRPRLSNEYELDDSSCSTLRCGLWRTVRDVGKDGRRTALRVLRINDRRRG